MAHDFHEYDQPRRSTKRRLSWLLLLVGALVIGAGLLFAWQFFQSKAATSSVTASPTSQPQQTSVSGVASPTSGSSGISPQGGAPTPFYYHTFEQHFAQGVHLTVSEVKARLQAGPPSLFRLAENQGLTQQQAYTLVLNALREAGNSQVQTHVWTQQQADADFQSWQQRDQEAVDGGATKLFMQY